MTVLKVELRKLAAQGRVRLLLLVCLLGPAALAVVLGVQSGLPKDTLFGRHVQDSGFALPLLVLGFAGLWGFPVLTSLVTAEVFAGEDGHGTWQAVLTRSRSRSQVFTGKLAAAALVSVGLLVVVALSSLLAGLALAGREPLLSLSGDPLPARRATGLVLLSWLCAVPPLLGFTALSCLLSVRSRSSVVGVGAPVLLALLMQLLALLGSLGTAANALLVTPFSSWHGLVREDAYWGPVWQGVLVSAAWTVVLVPLARRTLLTRDVT